MATSQAKSTGFIPASSATTPLDSPATAARPFQLRVVPGHTRYSLDRLIHSSFNPYWVTLANYTNIDDAYYDALTRRNRDGAELLCGVCGQRLQDDVSVTCEGCGLAWFPKSRAGTSGGGSFNPDSLAPPPKTLAYQWEHGLGALILAGILVALALACLKLFPNLGGW
jgi:hypothetical protein